ncbi:MAG: cytochrome c [Acidobacteriota bacterium]
MKSLKAVFALIFAAIFSVACGTTSESANKNTATPVATSTTPAATANANQPASGETMKASVDAKALYTEKCEMCHAADGKGNAQMKMKEMPNFTNAEWQKKETDEEFTKAIKEGKKPMPGFGDKMNDEQIKALVAYVRAFAKK